MLYAAMFDHVSLPAKLPFEKEEVGDLPKSSSSQKNENGELLALSIRAIKQSPCLWKHVENNLFLSNFMKISSPSLNIFYNLFYFRGFFQL
jgi:predicted nuclease of restriction endonuclease-like RecB superfamily